MVKLPFSSCIRIE